MIGILFILFNLSLYYTLSGFFLFMVTETQPFIWGIPILLAASVIHMISKTRLFPKIFKQNDKKQINPISILICALPAVFLLFNPTIIQIFHFLPAWALVAVMLLSDRVHIGHEAFKAHFSFTAKFYLLLLFAIFGPNVIMDSIITAITYFIIYLLSGMTLLRILRQEGKLSKSRDIIAMLALLLIGIVLTGLNMQQVLTSGLGFIYQGFALAIVGVTVGIVYILQLLFGHLFTPVYNGDAHIIGGGDQEAEYDDYMFIADDLTHTLEWLPQIATVVVIILAITLALLLMRYIKKRLTKSNKQVDSFIKEEEQELSKSQYKNTSRRKLFRPSDPRQAIRWYYRKYIKEGITRGADKPSISDTTYIINKKYSSLFPKNETKELRELYISARYQNKNEITKSMAEKATKLWRKL